MPFVGLDRRNGIRQVDRARGVRAARRGGALERRGRPRALRGRPQLRDAVVARFGEDVAPGGVVDRAARGASARSRAPRTAPGSRACCGRWSARASRVAAARCAPRSPAPRAAVVEVPLLFEAGIEGLYDATIAVVADEDAAPRARRAPRARVAGRARARQLRQQEKADARRSWCTTTAARRSWSGSCRRYLRSWADEPARALGTVAAIAGAALFVAVVAVRWSQQRRRATSRCRSATRRSSANRRPPSTWTRR